jgi:tryptophanyl-tRNA synthetase
MWEYFGEFREKRNYFEANQNEVREVLNAGAKRAKETALPIIEEIRSLVGIRY